MEKAAAAKEPEEKEKKEEEKRKEKREKEKREEEREMFFLSLRPLVGGRCKRRRAVGARRRVSTRRG